MFSDADGVWSRLASPICDENSKFRVLYCFGGDRKQLFRLLPVALNIIVERKLLKREVLAVHDESAVHVGFKFLNYVAKWHQGGE